MTNPDTDITSNNIPTLATLASTLADVRDLTTNVDKSLARVLEMLTDIRTAFREAQLAQESETPNTWVGTP